MLDWGQETFCELILLGGDHLLDGIDRLGDKKVVAKSFPIGGISAMFKKGQVYFFSLLDFVKVAKAAGSFFETLGP